MSGDYAIESHGLTRRFGAFTAVNHIDLRIPRAQIYGFLGPNGSGKSTTIRMLCGLLTPSEGEARVLGHPVPGDADALKQQIGYMTQRFSLYEDLDVQENLDFIADIYCLPRKTRRARIEAQLERYNLIEQRRQRAGTLSGGQKQRKRPANYIYPVPGRICKMNFCSTSTGVSAWQIDDAHATSGKPWSRVGRRVG
jgi:ABC-2 type transport system ATP-binding protein